MNLRVKSVDRFHVSVPYRAVPARNMVRELPHWTEFEIAKVTLESGVVGYGETMSWYTWGTVSDEAVAKVTGRNALEVMWDASLGAGLQMALFDAVGRACDVPCHRLMGHAVRDRAPVSWWCIDMPAPDWVAEANDAVAQGYTAMKLKARPWFDLAKQIDAVSRATPAHMHLDMDFNSMLNETGHATRVLTAIEAFPKVQIYETPIPQQDVAGNRFLRTQTRVPIAMHFGNPPIMTALHEDVCDGFVIGGDVARVIRHGTIAAEANKPFWLQLVGTGLTSLFSVHLAAVLTHARWPAVSCHQLYEHCLLAEPILVENGYARVPDGPGLGVDVDRDALERYRVPVRPKLPYPKQLLCIAWPSGAKTYYANAQQYWDDFLAGRLPVFLPGVHLTSVPDDGSSDWTDLQSRAQTGAVHTAA